MAYEWDNKKPTAQMLGRWQPFHDGHYALFQEIIKKTGQVCIQIRDVQGVDDNPFDFDTVKKNIEEKLNPEFDGRFKVMMVPNITNICYGRGVGYKIEEVASEGVKTSFFASGPNKIELLQATNPNSPIAKFIENKGEGIHHIAFAVLDIEEEVKRLQNEGFVVLNEIPKKGADNKLVVFLHPKSTNGVLIELCQEID